MRSPRAAVVIRTGIEIKPKVRCPFQTVVAMQKLLYKSLPGSLSLKFLKASRFPNRFRVVRLVGPCRGCKSNPCQRLQKRKRPCLCRGTACCALLVLVCTGGAFIPPPSLSPLFPLPRLSSAALFPPPPQTPPA